MNTEIKYYMTPAPIMVSTDTSVEEIMKIFKKGKFEHIPVINGNEELVGIISNTDIYQKLLHIKSQSSLDSASIQLTKTTFAKDIMTKNPVTITQEDTVKHAVSLLLSGMFHAIPVVEGGKVIGIVSSKDIMEELG